MERIENIPALRQRVAEWRAAQQRVALVPTMGNLHQGHLDLARRAKALAERCITTIFVNPTQFGPAEDYLRYPRTLEADCEQLAEVGVEAVFTPGVAEMYPHGTERMAQVSVPHLKGLLCGGQRPIHFDGVATVVTKLLNMVQPDIALFGEKDWQQLVVIRTLVRDLNMPWRIEGVATRREPDGLAMSSRNRYLTPEQRQRAPLLYQALTAAAAQLEGGERDFAAVTAAAQAQLAAHGLAPEYIEVRRGVDLQPPTSDDAPTAWRLFGAVRLGETRLIDNVPVA